MTTTNTYAPSLPQRPRVNMRLVVFLIAVALPFLAIGYLVITPFITGGIVRHGNYTEADLKALGQFMFDGVNGTINDVPQRFRDLDGKRVVLDGKMYVPQASDSNAANFQLVYDIQKCCFNGPPKVQERVFARVPQGKKVEIYDSLVQMTGIMHVRVVRDETGTILSVYDMDVEQVTPGT